MLSPANGQGDSFLLGNGVSVVASVQAEPGLGPLSLTVPPPSPRLSWHFTS